MRAKRQVEAVRCSLDLPKMQDSATVESAANKVSRQSVKVKVEGHQVPPGDLFEWLFWSYFGPQFSVQFINETNFPMKIVSGRIGCRKSNLDFVEDVQPRASYPRRALSHTSIIPTFSTGGYVIIYQNGILSSDTEPIAEYARVIEFALSVSSLRFCPPKINIQDKTNDEFSHGQDTHKTMTSGDPTVLYWFESGVHFMARAEIVALGFEILLWRFVIQEFDPFVVQD